MKFFNLSRSESYPALKKVYAIMRLTTLALIAFSLNISATVYSQKTKLSLDVNNQSIKEILFLIENQSEFRFIYESGKINLDKKVSVREKDQSVETILNRLFAKEGIKYEITENNLILINPAEKNDNPTAPNIQQQKKLITGVVTDTNGEPIIGANVIQKGATNGTSTDIDGNFSLEVPENTVLQISFIGYIPQEIQVKNQSVINVLLKEDTQALEEVVVVGYGVQKKANLSGSVGVVKNEVLQNRPITNVGSALQGTVANLNITNQSGAANSSPEINIRGFTSINGGSPLIIIDGIASDSEILNRINPSDIESISVLKDASSAAIYGSRAAYGVLLVTTKSGKDEKLSINYNGNFALRTMARLTELETDPYTVASIRNTMAYPWYYIYTEEELEYAKKRSLDPRNVSPYYLRPDGTYAYFDSVDWYDEAYRNVGLATTHSVDISGKTNKLSYYFSGSYFFQDGMLKAPIKNDEFNRYNLRAKLDFEITKWWNIGGNISFSSSDYDEPAYLEDMFWSIGRESSLTPLRNPDGTWTRPNVQGPTIVATMTDGGRNTTIKNDYLVQLSTKMDIIKNVLTLRGNFGLNRFNSRFRSNWLPVALYDGPNRPVQYSRTTALVRNNSIIKDHLLFDVYADFTKTFKEKHFAQVLLGFNQEEVKYNKLEANRQDLISNSLPTIELATGDMTMSEKITSEAFRGAFFRFNYIYNNKYIAEFNGRYDGTSSFPRDDRFVFNPSGSLAWVISQESFFQPLSKVISHLKLRASYGSLGNQSVEDVDDETLNGPYRYIPTLASGKTIAILDGIQPTYISAPGLVSSSLTWETVTTVNVGWDINFFNNRLVTTTDIYRRDTKNMLTKSKTLPSVLGTNEPKENAADLKTVGWDLTIGWNDRFKLKGKDFKYNVNFVLSDNRSYITKFDNPTGSLSTYYKGQEIGEIWGAKTLGFFTSEEDIKNHADQSFVTSYPGTRPLGPGDLKFEDRNKDGKIDYGKWTTDDHGDYYVIGNSNPRFNFSFIFNGEWNGFDVQAFFQGVGKRDYMPSRGEVNFWGVYYQPWNNVTKGNMDHWTEENPDAYFPRLKSYVGEVEDKELGVPQTRYLQNAAYLRLKNLTLGYTLPQSLTNKWNISRLRFYLSGENIAEITGLSKYYNVDPENLGGSRYPFQRSFSIGANVSF